MDLLFSRDTEGEYMFKKLILIVCFLAVATLGFGEDTTVGGSPNNDYEDFVYDKRPCDTKMREMKIDYEKQLKLLQEMIINKMRPKIDLEQEMKSLKLDEKIIIQRDIDGFWFFKNDKILGFSYDKDIKYEK